MKQDLVILLSNVHIADLTIKQIEEIEDADWFEPKENKRIVLIDKNQLSEETANLFEVTPIDCKILKPDASIKIDDCLKRWNESDGFYHA